MFGIGRMLNGVLMCGCIRYRCGCGLFVIFWLSWVLRWWSMLRYWVGVSLLRGCVFCSRLLVFLRWWSSCVVVELGWYWLLMVVLLISVQKLVDMLLKVGSILYWWKEKLVLVSLMGVFFSLFWSGWMLF